MTIRPDDPILTAFALGELDDVQRKKVEACLARDEACRNAVQEIRALAGGLEAELADEGAPGLTELQRRRIERSADAAPAATRRLWPRVAGLAAAAVVATALALMAPSLRSVPLPASAVSDAARVTTTGTSALTIGQPDPNVAASEAVAGGPASPGAGGAAEEASGNEQGRRDGSPVAATPPLALPLPEPETQVVQPSVSYGQVARVAHGAEDLDRGGTRTITFTDEFPDDPSATAGDHRSVPPRSPGTSETAGAGSPNAHGARERDFKAATGGVSNVDPLVDPYVLTETVTAEAGARQAGSGQEASGEVVERRARELQTAQNRMMERAQGESARQLRSLGYVGDLPDGRHYATIVGGDSLPSHRPGFNTEAYDHIRDNPFIAVAQDPLSTFSIDVDTASYSNVRRFLDQGQLPPPDAVRIEEMVNYFSYDYEPPRDGRPFAAHVEVAQAPWAPDHRLVRVGLKGRVIDAGRRPPSNLVFLLDVSGSMQPHDKLPLVRRAMHMLVDRLDEGDRVAIVVYAGASGLVLPSTPVESRGLILDSLDRLEAGGSTHGSDGIRLAYEVAARNMVRGGTNRVILCTDGDFNVGVTNRGDLIRLIEDRAKSGVFLSVLGFGMGNYKDATLEQLADRGNGNYAYIDNLAEARKVLVEQMAGTLVTIAKDVKIQVEFNPAAVNAYRLIGYENRKLAHQDFNDDTKDAGEIGAGHTVTALYEVVPAGVALRTPSVDPLRYQAPVPRPEREASGELLTVKLRYKQPDGNTSTRMAIPVTDEGLSWRAASDDFRFAAAVAAFGMILRDSPHRGGATLGDVRRWAHRAAGVDRNGYRAGFLRMIRQARGMPLR